MKNTLVKTNLAPFTATFHYKHCFQIWGASYGKRLWASGGGLELRRSGSYVLT